MSRILRLRIIAVLAAAALLTGCSAPAPAGAPAASAPIELAELDTLSPTEVVDVLEAVPVAERPTAFTVSVRPDKLVVTTKGGETERALPDDAFYLSFAPYLDTTHECFFHSLTTCHGELGGERIDVTITAPSGDVLVDDTLTAADNGFVGVWLPRGIRATLTTTYEGKSATAEIGTGPDDPTCLTTLQLS